MQLSFESCSGVYTRGRAQCFRSSMMTIHKVHPSTTDFWDFIAGLDGKLPCMWKSYKQTKCLRASFSDCSKGQYFKIFRMLPIYRFENLSFLFGFSTMYRELRFIPSRVISQKPFPLALYLLPWFPPSLLKGICNYAILFNQFGYFYKAISTSMWFTTRTYQ